MTNFVKSNVYIFLNLKEMTKIKIKLRLTQNVKIEV